MKRLFIPSLIAITMLVGCAPLASRYEVSTTAFVSNDGLQTGSISVLAADPLVNSSLEFNFYKKQIEDKLTGKGYVISSNPAKADLILYASYGIDSGTNKSVSVPSYGQIGGGTTFSSGTVSTGSGTGYYSGTSYQMPTYGITGSTSVSVTSFKRVIALDIFKVSRDKNVPNSKLVELRSQSTGSCKIFTQVFPFMLDAIFMGYPWSNGKTNTLAIPIPPESSC